MIDATLVDKDASIASIRSRLFLVFFLLLLLLASGTFVIRLRHAKEFSRLYVTCRHNRQLAAFYFNNFTIRVVRTVQTAVRHCVLRENDDALFDIVCCIQSINVGHAA